VDEVEGIGLKKGSFSVMLGTLGSTNLKFSGCLAGPLLPPLVGLFGTTIGLLRLLLLLLIVGLDRCASLFKLANDGRNPGGRPRRFLNTIGVVTSLLLLLLLLLAT